MADGREKIEKYGCDGVMVGRGIFGKPWFFRDETYHDTTDITFRLRVMVEHAKAFEKAFKNIKSFDVMKKHFKAYVSGWDGAKELRVELMATKSANEVAAIVTKYLNNL
jgi:tRNA-dihydrouridine synthase